MVKYICVSTTEHDFIIALNEGWLSSNFGRYWKFGKWYLKKTGPYQVDVTHLKEYVRERGQPSAKVMGCYVGSLEPGIHQQKSAIEEIKKNLITTFVRNGKIAIKDKVMNQIILSAPIEGSKEIVA